MEDIASKVEDFSSDEEILGAYDAEWHKIETERVVKLAAQEELEELKQSYIKEGLEEGIERGIEQGIEQTAINMLKENIDINIISKVTGLNISQIKELESK